MNNQSPSDSTKRKEQNPQTNDCQDPRDGTTPEPEEETFTKTAKGQQRIHEDGRVSFWWNSRVGRRKDSS